MISLAEFLLLVAAVDAVMFGWFKGASSSSSRLYLESWVYSELFHKRFIAKLLTCPVCLSVHLAFWLCVIFFLVPLGSWAITVLAIAGLAHKAFAVLLLVLQDD